MKTITIRDLRLRWPQTEQALEVEREMIVTRDGRPVAKLVRIVPEQKKRRRWDPEEHRRWQRKVNQGNVARWVDKTLTQSRGDRWPLNPAKNK